MVRSFSHLETDLLDTVSPNCLLNSSASVFWESPFFFLYVASIVPIELIVVHLRSVFIIVPVNKQCKKNLL